MNDLIIIATGSLVAINASLLGCFLIMRKMAMVGDAISHSVLPGIVIAFLLTGSRDALPMLLGAGLLGLASTFLIEFLFKKARLQSDASIGVTFTFLFAVGVVLISLFAGKVDLDQDCVLYGEIAYAPLDVWITDTGMNLGPRHLYTLVTIFAMIVAFISIGFKELVVTTFDPAYASSIGISPARWHYLLMGMVSLVTVASFESVGAILVVAFLVVPPATAYLLTDNFKHMLYLSGLIGTIAATSGHYLAVWLDGSIAGGMTIATGLLFIIALILSPTHGLLIKIWKSRLSPAHDPVQRGSRPV